MHICNVYMGFRRAIYTYIAPTPRAFSSEVKNCRGQQSVPEGRRPEGTDCCPRQFFNRGRKNRGGGGYIGVYSPTRPHIYNKCPLFYKYYPWQQFQPSWHNGKVTGPWRWCSRFESHCRRFLDFDFKLKGIYMKL